MSSRRTGGVTALRTGQAGYVMVIALVITAMGLAAAFAAVALAVAGSRVAAADIAAERALAAAQAGLADAADRLVWGGLPALWQGTAETSFPVGPDAGRSAAVTVRRVAGAAEPDAFEIEARGASGTGTATATATIALTAVGLPRGVTVAGDLQILQPLSVDGCGLYVDGDVTGRQHVVFAAGAGGTAGPDLALPAAWATAAVHAGGRIYDAAGETHEAGTASPDDTDACVGEPNARDEWPPSPDAVTALAAHHWAGMPPAVGDTLDLALLADRIAGSPPPAPQTGVVIVVRPSSGCLTVSGWWPQTPETPQITLLVLGDAELAASGAASGAAVHGALLVTGRLRVATPSLVVGFLAAGALEVAAPLSVALPAGWQLQPPPGSLVAVRGATARRSPPAHRSRPFRAAGHRRTVVTRGEGCRYLLQAAVKPALGSLPVPATRAGEMRRSRALMESLPELNTMLTNIVGQWLRRPRVQGAKRRTLKRSSRVAEVGAGMAKGWRARVV